MSEINRNNRWCRLSLKDTIKAVASLLIPFMIGVFTLVLAWQEHVQGQANRLNDIEIANTERMGQIRLEEFRRDQDHQLAARVHMDSVLSTFYQEMSQLILENNVILTNETMRQTFVRPKILSTLRQLDPTRKALVIKYLYESKLLLVDKNPLDLSGADLSNIDLSCPFRYKSESGEKIFSTMKMQSLSLLDVNLVNASFDNLYLTWSNFERSDLTGVSFRGSSLRDIIFYQTNLSFTDFTNARTVLADFEEADFTGSNINKEQLFAALSSYKAILPNGQQQYERFNRLSHLGIKQCSLDKWQHSLNIDVVRLSSNQSQCAYRGRTFNASLIGLIDVAGLSGLIDIDKAWITVELDAQRNGNPQDSATLPVNVDLRFFKNVVPYPELIDKDVNLFQLPPIGNLNASTNFYRLKGATACPIGTRAIEIEIKFTLDAVCYNINLYIEHARTPENEYDETFEDI